MKKDYAFLDKKGRRGHGGVAVLARRNMEIALIGADDKTRMISVVVKGTQIDILLIAAYLPTGTLRDKCIE